MAELRPHYIDVDLKKNTQYNVPVVTQNDTATHFIIRVTDDGLTDPELLDAYQEITMTSQRPDGESFYLTGTRIPGTNEIEFHLGTDETAFSGSVRASLQFYLVEDASRYTSAQFRYDVKKDLTTNYTPTQREETLVEVVLRDGPGVIQEAREAIQAADGAIGRLEEVTEENKTIFRQPVNTFADLATTYPNPEHGTTVRVTSEAASYRFSDGTWVKTDEYNPTAIDQVTAQLADKANREDVTTTNEKVSELELTKRDKSEPIKGEELDTSADSNKIKLINLSDEVQQALTGDAPALSTLQGEAVTKEKIAPNGIDFFKHTKQVPIVFKSRPRNLFDKNSASIGYFVNTNTGILSTNESYSTSEYIPVIEGLDYSFSFHRFLAWYDVDRNFLSGAPGTGTTATLTAPAGAKYLRASVLNASFDTFMIEQSSTLGRYEPYFTELKLDAKDYFDDKSLGTELLGDRVVTPEKTNFFDVGKNLFDKKSAIPGYYVSASNGNLYANETYSVSDFIEFEPNETYARNYVNQIAFYNEYKEYISGISTADATTSFTSPENAKYVRVTLLTSGLDTYQLEKGTTTTEHEPFAYKISSNKIRVENKDDMFRTVQSVTSQLVLSATQKKVKLIGDSITHGSGGTGYAQDGEHIMTIGAQTWHVNTKGHCWANSLRDYLAEKHGTEVINYGCSGANSKTLVNGLDQLIDGTEDIVICMIGTNDRHNNTREELRSNLLKINKYCKDRDIEVIFMSNIPSSVAIESDPIRNYHMEDVDHVTMKVSNELNKEYISVYKEFIDYCEARDISIDSLLVDGLHPNNAGYDAMFYIISNALGFGVKRSGATW